MKRVVAILIWTGPNESMLYWILYFTFFVGFRVFLMLRAHWTANSVKERDLVCQWTVVRTQPILCTVLALEDCSRST